jgi:branched-chain amino acid transport system ATP-binding protein
MLAIAKALLMRPKVLIVDEMSLGLAPKIVQSMLPAIRRAPRAGATAAQPDREGA